MLAQGMLQNMKLEGIYFNPLNSCTVNIISARKGLLLVIALKLFQDLIAFSPKWT